MSSVLLFIVLSISCFLFAGIRKNNITSRVYVHVTFLHLALSALSFFLLVLYFFDVLEGSNADLFDAIYSSDLIMRGPPLLLLVILHLTFSVLCSYRLLQTRKRSGG